MLNQRAAVDNVLERFVDSNRKEPMLSEDQILRVATDQGKVNKSLQQFTIDARVGGDMNENNRLFKQAKKRVEAAMIIFTTCAGAGLGILRQMDFGTVIIDESTQITEPCALIPLVKACRRAVLVGDQYVSGNEVFRDLLISITVSNCAHQWEIWGKSYNTMCRCWNGFTLAAGQA